MERPLANSSAGSLSEAKRKLLEQRLKGKARTGSAAETRLAKRPSSAPRLASLGQRRIWFLHQLDPGSPSYNITSSFWVDSELDLGRLGRSIAGVVERHETLRSSYHADGAEVLQRVHDHIEVPLEIVEVSEDEDVTDVAETIARRPFDPEHPPLVRAHLLRRGDGSSLLMMLFHDIIFDKWSLGLFWKELAAIYNSGGTAADAPLPGLLAQ